MSFALVQDGVATRFFESLPREHWIVDTASTGHFIKLTQSNAASYGYLPVVDAARPADTATVTWNRTLVVSASAVTVVWVQVAKTAQQIADETKAAADELERQQARQAVENLRTYRALTTPTAAQTTAAVKLLAGVAIRLITDSYGPNE